MKYMLVLRASGSAVESMAEDSGRTAMAAYEERLVRAGVLLAAERLQPGPGVRVDLGATSGDLAEEHVSAASTFDEFWIVDAASSDEALEWARRCPASEGCIEVRRVVGPGDRRDAGARLLDGAGGRRREAGQWPRRTT
jgi:hypothetical protein